MMTPYNSRKRKEEKVREKRSTFQRCIVYRSDGVLGMWSSGSGDGEGMGTRSRAF